MRSLARFAACLLLLIPAMLRAETFPTHPNLFVNDLAGVIAPDVRTQIQSQLADLRDRSGVELSLLTIPSRKDYGSDGTLEGYVTGLFNNWGIGRKDRNDGVLIYLAPNDREMRIELGSGYGQDFNRAAAAIVEQTMLPALRKGDYDGAASAGVSAVISDIVTPYLANAPPLRPARSWLDLLMPWLFGLFGAGIVSMALADRFLGDWRYRFRRCPQCGARGLHRDHILQSGGDPPSPGVAGAASGAARSGGDRIVTWCGNCGYRHESPFDSHNAPGSRGGSFGGGSSSGGGASGRW